MWGGMGVGSVWVVCGVGWGWDGHVRMCVCEH